MDEPVVIGVAGGSGSGKTTIAHGILERVGAQYVAYLPHDAYYKDLSHLSVDSRVKINFDHPNSLETDLLIAHIQNLKAWKTVQLPIYDFKHHTRTPQTKDISPQPVVLVDGILIFAEPMLRELFDVKIFVDTDADIRFIRRLQRDILERGRTTESVISQYLETVRPMHLDFVEFSKRYADIIIPEGGLNIVAMDMIVARVQDMLHHSKKESKNIFD